MYKQTQGIVFHTTPYTDNSLIVKIYTHLFGTQTYMVKGVRGNKSRFRATYFQPLTILDLEVSYRRKNTIQSIKDVRISEPFISIPGNLDKQSILLFLNEILYKTIREEEANPPLFEFLRGFIYQLDRWQGNVALFHLYFLVSFSHYTGFFPQGLYSGSTPFFDLKEGCFVPRQPGHDFYLDKNLSLYLSQLMAIPLDRIAEITVSRPERKLLLNKLIHYYEFHFQHIPKIQSHHILEEIFRT